MIKKHILCASADGMESGQGAEVFAQLENDPRFELEALRLKMLATPDDEEPNLELKDAQIEEIIRKSYLSEAILLPKSIYFKNFYPEIASRVHCPLILFTGEGGHGLRHILFVVSNNPDSVVAIKQFCHLFPSFCQELKVTLLIYDDGSGMEKIDEQMVVKYIKQWNRNLGVMKVNSERSSNLEKDIEFDENTLCVFNFDLIKQAKNGSFPDKVHYDQETSIFLAYNY